MTETNYVDPAEWSAWEAQREAANAAYDQERRDTARRRMPQQIEELADRVQELELALFLTELVLGAAVERCCELRGELDETGTNTRALEAAA